MEYTGYTFNWRRHDMLESIIIGVSQIHEGLEREEGEGGDEIGTCVMGVPISLIDNLMQI